MRVITGSARGRKLETLPGTQVIRPTTDSVKEAMFSAIQFEIAGRRILDLFAGSGQLGIEALSRGAERCAFVEADKKAAEVVARNLTHCHLEEKARLFCMDACAFLQRESEFDVAFLDPPYEKQWIDRTLPLLVSHMAEEGMILCETQKEEPLPAECGAFSIAREYRYGKTKVTLYRRG